MSGTTEARMSAVEERLAGLGLAVPEVAAPVAAYVPAVMTGNYVYTSGQLPFIKGQLPKLWARSGHRRRRPSQSPEEAKSWLRRPR